MDKITIIINPMDLMIFLIKQTLWILSLNKEFLMMVWWISAKIIITLTIKSITCSILTITQAIIITKTSIYIIIHKSNNLKIYKINTMINAIKIMNLTTTTNHIFFKTNNLINCPIKMDFHYILMMMISLKKLINHSNFQKILSLKTVMVITHLLFLQLDKWNWI